MRRSHPDNLAHRFFPAVSNVMCRLAEEMPDALMPRKKARVMPPSRTPIDEAAMGAATEVLVVTLTGHARCGYPAAIAALRALRLVNKLFHEHVSADATPLVAALDHRVPRKLANATFLNFLSAQLRLRHGLPPPFLQSDLEQFQVRINRWRAMERRRLGELKPPLSMGMGNVDAFKWLLNTRHSTGRNEMEWFPDFYFKDPLSKHQLFEWYDLTEEPILMDYIDHDLAMAARWR